MRTGRICVPRFPGRPPRPIEPWEVHIVQQAWEDYRVGACLLEGRIEEDYGVHIGHNRIHRIMLELGISGEEMRKKGRRKWVHHERDHSMELWHTDWKWMASQEEFFGEHVLARRRDLMVAEVLTKVALYNRMLMAWPSRL